jgi:hypothetical protein
MTDHTPRHRRPDEDVLTVTVTVTLHGVRLPAETPGPVFTEAVESLAAIMAVQAEDGIYTTGNPDDPDAAYLAGYDRYDTAVSVHRVTEPPNVGERVILAAVAVPEGPPDADYTAAIRARMDEIYPDAGGYDVVTPRVLSSVVVSPSAYRTILAAASVGLDTDDPAAIGLTTDDHADAWSAVHTMTTDTRPA